MEVGEEKKRVGVNWKKKKKTRRRDFRSPLETTSTNVIYLLFFLPLGVA